MGNERNGLRMPKHWEEIKSDFIHDNFNISRISSF
jgi:hypothetical protein